MKKIMAFILCVLMLLPFGLMSAGAVSLSEGKAKLDRQFKNGTYSSSYDYIYYSPVKTEENDTTKYPLLIWLHGMNSGTFARAQLQWYEFSNWASDEYQARFANAGGCFLLAPRAAGSSLNSWDGTMRSDLKKIIDSFIEKNADHIDTSRIYIAGYSTGGSMVWEMVTAYPAFFAAALPLAAITQPTTAGLNKLTDVSLWIFTSDNDPYIINETSDVMPNFEYLAQISNRSDCLRLTHFSDARFADNTKKTESNGSLANDAEHYIWEAVTYDMFMDDGVTPYVFATTIDSTGSEIELNTPGIGVIDWLSRQTNKKNENSEKLGFFAKIKLFFERLGKIFRELFSGIRKGN